MREYMPIKHYSIRWGHSGTYGKEWRTARDASNYASTEFGVVRARSAEAAIRQLRRELAGIIDWYEDLDENIHVIFEGEKCQPSPRNGYDPSTPAIRR